MQKLEDAVFSVLKTESLSPAVFSFLQPTGDSHEQTPQGGILSDAKYGWLALGPKLCVIDVKSGSKVAAWTFGASNSNTNNTITCVIELQTPLTENSRQLVVSVECEDSTGLICIFHINGSQILRCIQTEVVVTQLVICDEIPDGPFVCFDGVVLGGTKSGEIVAFDLNRSSLIEALKNISQGYDNLVRNELSMTNMTFLPLKAIPQISEQRELAIENDEHLTILLNENSLEDGQYYFHNPDGSIRMKAKRDHIRVSALEYVPQLGSLVVGYNFGAYQIWNLMTLELEFTSQVNVECLPVTQFAFQEPCDDPRAFCYMWVVYSVTDRFEEEEFPLAVMYSLNYQGKRMLSDTKYLYQDFVSSCMRFQIELSSVEGGSQLVGGRCVSCYSYSIDSTLGQPGEDNLLNVCQIVWELWRDNATSCSEYGMLLFDLDQWYKAQMPATYQLESSTFMSTTSCKAIPSTSRVLSARLSPNSVLPYCHAERLEEHLYPNSLQYDCIILNTSEILTLHTSGVQRQLIAQILESGSAALMDPARLCMSSVACGLTPLYAHHAIDTLEEQRRFLLSVCLEARLVPLLRRSAHELAAWGGAPHLMFLVDWCWRRAIELKQNATELIAPLFTSTALPDRNMIRCLEHCVLQLTELKSLLDSILTKCCNLLVPDALSEIEEKQSAVGCVTSYLLVVQWSLCARLLPSPPPMPTNYHTRRIKLHRLQHPDSALSDDEVAARTCPLLYVDQLIEHEFGGDRVRQLWSSDGQGHSGLYPPANLASLLRLYLLPDVAPSQKHSLLLYLLIDYSSAMDATRDEEMIRKLMQFPTMFGLSNSAIKATQAFWHLDHRDFDFALDQLQCLNGNNLSEWQHRLVLSSLLAQKKYQLALQYLHGRKPAPSQKEQAACDYDKMDDWQCACDLYMARGLIFEALDVIRVCIQNTPKLEEKVQLLDYFFNACARTEQLHKLLEVSLTGFEEEMLIRYLQRRDDAISQDLLVLYYLLQARYLEAQQCNNKLKQSRGRQKELTASSESVVEVCDKDSGRDALVEVMCAALPSITGKLVDYTKNEMDFEPHVFHPKPMSVYVQAKSPKNTFTYKSSFIQDTIENASETWINKPKLRKGLKRALEETPFLCTPKFNRTYSNYSQEQQTLGTPPKRPRLDLTLTPTTPKQTSTYKPTDKLSKEIELLLDMPAQQSPWMHRLDRTRADTPQSILKIRRLGMDTATASPVDSRYLDDSDDDAQSVRTHHSDYTNKQLRFTIPTASESGSTPSPSHEQPSLRVSERHAHAAGESEMDVSSSVATRTMNETSPFESPSKRFASDEKVQGRKSYKDSVRARSSHSISANSSLTEDANASIESIADLPITLINPRYSKRDKTPTEDTFEREKERDEDMEVVPTKVNEEGSIIELRGVAESKVTPPKTPQGRRSIRAGAGRSRSVTPERMDSPTITPISIRRMNRSRSRTPEVSPSFSALDSIPELPRHEVESEPHAATTLFSATSQLRPRSRSRTPERVSKEVWESPRLEAITESPSKPEPAEELDPSSSSPSTRSLRSRSRTPEVEVLQKSAPSSPRSLRRRSKTPDREKVMSPIEKPTKSKKSLSRMVLEQNAFSKTKPSTETAEVQSPAEEKSLTKDDSTNIECTPMKNTKSQLTLLDFTFSPIDNKSVLQSSSESVIYTEKTKICEKSQMENKTLPGFTISESFFQKSVLRSYESSVADNNTPETSIKDESMLKEDADSTMECTPSKKTKNQLTKLLGFSFSPIVNKSVLESSTESVCTATVEKETKISETPTENKSFRVSETSLETSVLKSYDSLGDKKTAENIPTTSKEDKIEIESSTNKSVLKDMSSLITNDSTDTSKQDDERILEISNIIQKEKDRIVEIEREIHEIEGDMSEDESSEGIESGDSGSDGSEESIDVDEEDESEENEEVCDVISIADTSSDDLNSDSSSSGAGELQIDETSRATDTGLNEPIDEEKHQQTGEINDKLGVEGKYDEIAKGKDQQTTKDKEKDQQTIKDKEKDQQTTKDKEKDVEIAKGKGEEAEKKLVQNIEQPNERQEKNVETMERNTEQASDKIENNVEPIIEEAESRDIVPMDVVEVKESQNEDIPVETGECAVEEMNDPLAANMSIMTDDNSALDADNEHLKLSYSDDEDKAEEKNEEPKTEIHVEVTVEKIPEEEMVPEETVENPTEIRTDVDVVDAITTTQTKEKTPEAEEKPAPKTRKRVKSTSSNKSIEIEKPKTPTRKRVKSTSLNQSPESTEEPSVRRILTRRASKELSESITEEDYTLTPKRRTRSRSKVDDDNASVASNSSFGSRASEDIEGRPVRKGRKSAVATKPELSVIPEISTEEPSKDNSEIMSEYASARRLTRHQKSLLQSWLHTSAAASTSTSDMLAINDINILDNMDSQGSPDAEESEVSHLSPNSIPSEAGSLRRSRMTRALSETKTLTKVKKPARRGSIDIVNLTERAGSPLLEAAPGAARPRRASFNKAREALTPKRPTSSMRGDSESGSPEAGGAGRRGRRSSTHSNTSSGTPRRSKKPATDDSGGDYKK